MLMVAQRSMIVAARLILLVTLVLALQPEAHAALVQYWRLDDGAGTTAANEVGGNTGTLMPGVTPTWTNTGLYTPLTTRSYLPSTYALDFESDTTDYVDGGNLGLVANGSGGQATVAMWIKPESLTGDNRLYGQLSGLTSQAGVSTCSRMAAPRYGTEVPGSWSLEVLVPRRLARGATWPSYGRTAPCNST